MPYFALFDKDYSPNDSGGIIQSSTMLNNTDWQTYSLTYTPDDDKEVEFRWEAGGSGNSYLYWFLQPTIGGQSVNLFDVNMMGGIRG